MKSLLLIFSVLLALVGRAQYSFFEPEGSFAIEVSLDNSKLIRLPIYRNSISSLAVVKDDIIGGTKADAGLSPFLFVASITSKEMVATLDLETVIPRQQGLPTGFQKAGNVLYAGTIANNGGSGHLIQVTTSANQAKLTSTQIQATSQTQATSITVIDLGTPIPNEGILALTFNQTSNTLFGISYPTGYFFSYNIGTKQIKKYDNILPSKENFAKLKDEFLLTPDDYLCKALISDNTGNVYGSTPINRIFSFNVKSEKFTLLKDSLPEVWGRNVLGQVESWVKAPNGLLYGGNAGDGQLFSLNPANGKIKNLGKPIMAARLRSLTFGKDGKLYGIAGALPGYSHLFSYSESEGFKDYGNPQFKMKAPGIEQGIDWRGFQLGSIASSEDGKFIVIGEDESLSQLLVFPVKRH